MLADYVFVSKYSKYMEHTQRRETYEESIDRMMDMHESKFQDKQIPKETFNEIRQMLKDKIFIGSQRALQFGGAAILEKNWRIFNCTTSYCDRPKFFAEALWLLLAGAGVGFSICRNHVSKLPMIQNIDPQNSQVYEIQDSIEGWADALLELINGFMGYNPIPFFDFSQIRPKGAKLRHGGKAPGSQGLEYALDKIRVILTKAQGRQLRPIECLDIVMHASDAVLAGGVRRSSAIAVFDADDEEMLNAKTGNWFIDNPQRGRANISAAILPSTPKETYESIFSRTRQWGEPGFLFLAHEDYVLNPCSEASMCPQLITDPNGNVVEEYTLDILQNKDKYRNLGYKYESGWQACNLTSVNGAKIKTQEDFLKATKYATILGTFQTTYSNPCYLEDVSRKIVERENLLGVSITGMMMNKEILLNAEHQQQAARLAVETNEEYARILGIRPSSRITLVKPEGTGSLVLESTSGIHPAHAPKYIRHVQSTDIDPPFLHFKETNPQACFDSVWSADKSQKVIAFPIEFKNAIYSYEVSAIELLNYSKLTQQNWVTNGTAKPNSCEQLKHNVSITVSVKSDEWDAVKEYLWQNRDYFTGVALLSASGDYDFEQAPFVRVFELHEIDTEDPHYAKKVYYAKLWEQLNQTLKLVDYTTMLEETDNTQFVQEAACAGGQCSVSF